MVLGLWGGLAKAQDPQFTQFYANSLYLSPSFAGAVKDSRLTASYRNQWTGLSNSFNTFNVAVDHYFYNLKSGFGLIAFRDVAGSLNLSNTLVGVLYSYNIPLNFEWYVRPGVGFYYDQRSIDYSNIVLGDQLSSGGQSSSISNLKGNASKRSFDFSASSLLVGPNVWVGFALDHLLRPDRSLLGLENRLPVKFSVHGGYRFVIQGYYLRPVDESVTAAFNYKQQGIFHQFDLGLYWYKRPIMVGVWYRGIPIAKNSGTDALAFLIGLKVPKFNIAYSYDLTLSNFGVDSGGAHEISLTYEFSTQGRKKWKAVPCPEF
ncbi:PorP/SprF family type IX secretion system membrane protein [Acetobacteroides hydrogenigenes]|uniref:PorP/SprF family type IX secretion system membrane protein n=1 Tax=Acetobacteroides hydrogenigenes TaxID=979970 RepID=UPI0014050ED4|nr:PorP/SprF family type IX secretion system membrane protein [Acetobacteroides hydrogenigenes]